MNRQNILLLNLNHIGDILFTTPAIRALRLKYPDVRISVVVLEGLADLLRNNPNVDEVLTRRRGAFDILKLVPKVRARRCGISVLFNTSSVRMAALGKYSGAEVRVGFDDPRFARFLTHPMPLDATIHRADAYLNLARAVGAEIDSPRMEMFLSEIDRSTAIELLRSVGVSGERPIAAISPGSTVSAKEWFPERYAEVADRLAADGMDVIIVGSASERPTIDRVLSSATSQLADLSGRTSIAGLAALLERCDVVVSNDTGPMHLAVSVDTPVVAILGPTDPRVFGPYDKESVVFWEKLDCSPCGYSKCDTRECLDAISAERVYAAAARLASARRCRT